MDWSRTEFYAEFVQVLTVYVRRPNRAPAPPEEVVTRYTSPGRPLFPNLKKLIVQGPNVGTLDSWAPVLSPSLVHIQLHQIKTGTTNLAGFCHAAATTCTKLTTFDAEGSPQISEVIAGHVSVWRSLRDVRLGTIMHSDRGTFSILLSNLSILPSLQRLSVTPAKLFSPISPLLSFPSLQSLESYNCEGLPSLLRSISAPKLINLSIPYPSYYWNQWDPQPSISTSSSFSTLESLNFQSMNRPLRLAHLMHFTNCQGLSRVDIGPRVMLSGEEVNALVREWPQLHDLTLETGRPLPKLVDLGSLYDSAPNLRNLVIGVDGTSTQLQGSSLGEMISLIPPHKGICRVRLFIPDNQDAELIRKALRPLWPNARIKVVGRRFYSY